MQKMKVVKTLKMKLMFVYFNSIAFNAENRKPRRHVQDLDVNYNELYDGNDMVDLPELPEQEAIMEQEIVREVELKEIINEENKYEEDEEKKNTNSEASKEQKLDAFALQYIREKNISVGYRWVEYRMTALEHASVQAGLNYTGDDVRKRIMTVVNNSGPP